MRKFMLTAYDNVSTYANVSAEEMQTIVEKYMAWTADIAKKGQLVIGEKLKDEPGKAITQSNGAPSVAEGPYTEANEVMSGFWIIQTETEEEAMEIANSCPHTAVGTLGFKEVDPTA